MLLTLWHWQSLQIDNPSLLQLVGGGIVLKLLLLGISAVPATTKPISDELRKKIRAMVSTGVPTLAPRFAKLILENFS